MEAAKSDAPSDERQCRYCFGGPPPEGEDAAPQDELIAPCGCVGGQRWVHAGCLRKWQTSVLVSQPARQVPEADDIRASRCGVCLQTFSLAPPSRHEVLREAVGPALIGLLAPGSIVGTTPKMSQELEGALRSGRRRRAILDFVHWARATYLVHFVGPRQLVLSVPDELSRQAALELVSSDGLFELQGQRYHLLPEEHGRWGSSSSSQDSAPIGAGSQPSAGGGSVRTALEEAKGSLPTQFWLEAEVADGVEDAVRAVNLSRPIAEDDLSEASCQALRAARAEAAAAVGRAEVPGKAAWEAVEGVRLRHFLGGPCDQARCVALLRPSPDTGLAPRPAGFRDLSGLGVAGGDLAAAIVEVAAGGSSSSRAEPEGDSPPSAKRPRLGAAEEEEEEVPAVPALLVFWGEARWSRMQLLSELARGFWGLCTATARDLEEAKHSSLWRRLAGSARRLSYADAVAGSVGEASDEEASEQR